MSNATFEVKQIFEQTLKKATEKYVGEVFDEQLKKLNERKNEIVAGIVLNITKMTDIQTIGEKTIITIREIKK